MKLKISTLGGLMMALLVIATAASVIMSIRVTDGIHRVDEAWINFDENVGRKILLKHRLNMSLGYGGMIHQLKNYVLRQDGERVPKVTAAMDSAMQVIQEYRALPNTAREIAALDAIADVVTKYRGAMETAVAMIAAGRNTNEIDKATRVDDTAALEAVQVLNDEIRDQERAASEQIHGTSVETAELGTFGTYMVATVLGLVILALGWFLIFRLLRPLKTMTGAMGELATGNLDVAVPAIDRQDEVGDMARALQVFKQNALKVQDMELSTDRIIDIIAESAGQVGSAIAEQAASSSEQAAAVSQTSTSLEEIRQTADKAIQQAHSLSRSAEQAMEQGESGQQRMANAMTAMNDIREKVEAIAHTMVVLSEQTRRVGEITDSVSALAQQSKMLAINASIEAAKAGEAGQGFAVVAEEVANLAEQSEQATTQVRSVLEQIQSASEKAIFATEEGTKQVDAGVSLIELVGQDIGALTGVIDETVSGTRNMVASIQQQAAGIEQVSSAMTDISSGTSQVAASTNQIRGSVDSLNDEVQKLAKARD